MSKAIVLCLLISSYKGTRYLVWKPSDKLNLIIGGGDIGKSTLLDAIGLLFHPSNSKSLSGSDYYNRNITDGFEIEAVLSVSDDFKFTSGSKMYWPWEWDGENAVLPNIDQGATNEVQQPVYRVIVSGSSDLELKWEVIQPDGSRDHFSVGARRQIGLVSLTSEDNHDRDLRFVYGSALDRLLADGNLRAKVLSEISEMSFTDQLSDESREALSTLDETFAKQLLPANLSLGMAGAQGISIGSLLGLFSEKDGVSLPLSRWGSGTKRIASLYLAQAVQSESSIALIDELERGLEPYRLRKFMNMLIESEAQCFITTHSPIALGLLESGSLWYLDSQQHIGELTFRNISAQLKRDPETFLSKVAVVVEGETEQGFVCEVLEKLLGGDPMNIGVRVANGQGDDQLLALLEILQKANLCFCGFADNDGGNGGRWENLKTKMGARLFQWSSGCIETNVIPLIPDEEIEILLKDEEGEWDGDRLRTIAERMELESKEFNCLIATCDGDRSVLKQYIVDAATGDTSSVSPEDNSKRKAWKKHSQKWFKRADGSGGRELVRHLVQTNQWEKTEEQLRPFFNSILSLANLQQIEIIEL